MSNLLAAFAQTIWKKMTDRDRGRLSKAFQGFLVGVRDPVALQGLLDRLFVHPFLQPALFEIRERLLVALGQGRGEIPGGHHLQIVVLSSFGCHQLQILFAEVFPQVFVHQHADAESGSIDLLRGDPFLHIGQELFMISAEDLRRRLIRHGPAVHIGEEGFHALNAAIEVPDPRKHEEVDQILLIVPMGQIPQEGHPLPACKQFFRDRPELRRPYAQDALRRDVGDQLHLKGPVALILFLDESFIQRHAPLRSGLPSGGEGIAAFKCPGHLLQIAADGQVLRAGALAAAAFDAGAGLAVARQDQVVEIDPLAGPASRGALEAVVQGKILGDRDLHGAAVDAVFAGGAGDGRIGVEELRYLADDGVFLLAEGSEVPEHGAVVLHLLQAVHAAEHPDHPGLSGGKAQGPAGHGGLGGAGLQQSFRLRGNADQGAALAGLHDRDGLMILPGHLQAPAGLDVGLVHVHVIHLQLDKIQAVAVAGEDLLQQLRGIMEGHPHIKDLSLRLLFPDKAEGVVCHAAGEDVVAHVVQQIVVKIRDAAVLQLLVENGFHVLRILEIPERQLRGQLEALPGMPLHQRFADGLLPFVAVIGIGRIEIGKTQLQEAIKQGEDPVKIEAGGVAGIQQRQAHGAEAKAHVLVGGHVFPSLSLKRSQFAAYLLLTAYHVLSEGTRQARHFFEKQQHFQRDYPGSKKESPEMTMISRDSVSPSAFHARSAHHVLRQRNTSCKKAPFVNRQKTLFCWWRAADSLAFSPCGERRKSRCLPVFELADESHQCGFRT